MPARLADPVLPLQTMNAHCNAVRAAAAAATRPPPATPEELTKLINLHTLELKELREGYAFVKGHPLLEQRYEAAGTAVRDLLWTLRRMRGDQ